MSFPRITGRDKPETIAQKEAKYEALLQEAVSIAKNRAKTQSPLLQSILATATVEGKAVGLNAKVSALTYRAEKYKRTWVTLLGWKDLEYSTPEEQAEGILLTLEGNIDMTETNSWPALPI